MWHLKKTTIILVLMGMFFVSSMLGQETAPVPMELAKTAALYHAKLSYGNISFHSVQTYYDLDGKPAVYAFILKLSGSQPPTIEQVKEKISKEYTLINTIRKDIESSQTLPVSGKKKSEKIAKLRARILDAQKRLSFSETFVTVFAGANENYVPVIRYHRGLPENLTRLPYILEKIDNDPEIHNMKPTLVYYVGMFNQFYALSASLLKSSEQVTTPYLSESSKMINLRTGIIETLSVLRQKLMQGKQSRVESAKDERANIIRKKWDAIKRLHQSSEPVPQGEVSSFNTKEIYIDGQKRDEQTPLFEYEKSSSYFETPDTEFRLKEFQLLEVELPIYSSPKSQYSGKDTTQMQVIEEQEKSSQLHEEAE